MNYSEIDKRYTKLAESTCCLSCGGAINYSDAVEGEVCIDLGSGRGTDVIRLAETVGKSGLFMELTFPKVCFRKQEIQLTAGYNKC